MMYLSSYFCIIWYSEYKKKFPTKCKLYFYLVYTDPLKFQHCLPYYKYTVGVKSIISDETGPVGLYICIILLMVFTSINFYGIVLYFCFIQIISKNKINIISVFFLNCS